MENRVLFGDCQERLAELEGNSVDLILTDPPYNTGLGAGGTRLRHFFDDSLPAEQYRALARTVSVHLYRVLRGNRAAYVFINWRSLGLWLDSLSAVGFRLKNCIVWDEVFQGLNHQNYAHTHEFLIFAVKGRFHPANRIAQDGSLKDVWHIRRSTLQVSALLGHHETVKPFELVRKPVEHASCPGDLVLDPFAGTGTTCVVAKALGRRYLGIERNAGYYRVCLRRLSDAPSLRGSA